MKTPLALCFLMIAGPAIYAQSPTPCYNCSQAAVHATAAMLWSSSGATATTGAIAGFLHAEAPLSSTQNLPRLFLKVSFYQIAGQAIPDPATIQSVEGEGGIKFYVAGTNSVKIGLACSVWANQKLNQAASAPQPISPSTYGYGCGPTAVGKDGSHASVEVGQDNFAGDQGGVQIRIRAKIAVPHTSVKGGVPIGNLVVDSRATLTSAPTAVVVAGATPTPVPAKVLNQTISFGIGIDADAVWGAIFSASATAATPSAYRAPEISKVRLAYGPPAPIGLY